VTNQWRRVAAMSVVVVGLVGLLGGCSVTTAEALPDARVATGADAPGFIVVGYADEQPRNRVLHVLQSLSLAFVSTAGEGARTVRVGCRQLYNTDRESCAEQLAMGRRVLQVKPGEWRLVRVGEIVRGGFPPRNIVLSAPLPRGTSVTVGPGEIVYIGDFLFAFNVDTSEVTLRTHSRDDAGAAVALERYPNLRGQPVVYRDPSPQG
jgi:hypothetical protein